LGNLQSKCPQAAGNLHSKDHKATGNRQPGGREAAESATPETEEWSATGIASNLRKCT
jgi:hypothetical protein